MASGALPGSDRDQGEEFAGGYDAQALGGVMRHGTLVAQTIAGVPLAARQVAKRSARNSSTSR